MYRDIQWDATILSWFYFKICTCFGHSLCPSSGVQYCIGSHWYKIWALKLEMCGSICIWGCPEWVAVTLLWLSWNCWNGLEVNADKTKYMVMSGDQIAGRSDSVKIDNSSFGRVEEFKYLWTTLTDQNSIQEEIKSRLKSGNACYHSVQNVLCSRLISKNLKIKIYRTIVLPVVLYGCETWSLTVREECRLWVFENRVLRAIWA
jgi:hypothetical protein